ncbi:type II secretion system protein N [Desulfurivibrio alkaliphilus]|uniref:Type II secretion system protein N n=1 Tax=Desulfurivibrio alkaliphilus (strain DSM 19089 / UNIQEM U267 / AHT2) TaxID=589865 RepID=D6Z6G4_DESAT|nr:type II secretion system protein N [Desulfurivibrio alkaliphilus]ADH86929.1 type II secretion system protein N [Desulfurivibrio alkaliphilus AHT 2]
MFTWKKQLAAGLAFFIFFLVYYFPAQLAWPLLQKSGVDLVELHGISGSWHHGSAAAGRVLATPVRDISWRFKPLPWAPARGEIELIYGHEGRLAAGFSSGYKGPQFGRAELTAVRAELPLVTFAEQLRRFGLAVDGLLAADLKRLVLEDGRPVAAEGEVFLLDFQALQPVPLVLGDFTGTFESAGDELLLNLRDQGGPLALDGVVRFTGEGYRFNAGLTPRDPDDRELTRVLAFLGSPGRDGAIPLRFSGQW